ncbi:unnamed protein product [Porites evermanni]|uniref:Uncharacterized protein n=1 Tax=Porites evermanni TaxID=104178 RepID=A0ABN8SQI9_9CNID|nr:unnamed protein product [Porites evermanni]
MTKYYAYGVSLSKGQLEKLLRAYNNNSAITIRLNLPEMSYPINKLRKPMSQGTGSDIKISKTQIRKAIKHGGSLLGSLISLGSKLLPMAMPLSQPKKLSHRLQLAQVRKRIFLILSKRVVDLLSDQRKHRAAGFLVLY